MTMHNTPEIALQLAPIQSLRLKMKTIEEYMYNKKWLWFYAERDDFSYVYGVSEVELRDLQSELDSTISHCYQLTKVLAIQQQQESILVELKQLEKLDLDHFIPDADHALGWWQGMNPLRKWNRSRDFKDLLRQVKYHCDNIESHLKYPEMHLLKEASDDMDRDKLDQP